MGWVSLILYRFTGLLCGKKLLISRTEINTDFKKLVRSHRTYSIKSMIRINFDLKPGILRLFFWAYWIDGVLFACSIVANIFYTSLFFYLFFVQHLPSTIIRFPPLHCPIHHFLIASIARIKTWRIASCIRLHEWILG